MTVPQIDTTAFPLVVIVFASDVSFADIDAYLVNLREPCSRGPFGVVADIDALTHAFDAVRRKYLADGVNRLLDEFPTAVVAEGVHTSSTVLRGMLIAYNWVRAPKHPTRWFANRTNATKWVRGELALHAMKHPRMGPTRVGPSL